MDGIPDGSPGFGDFLDNFHKSSFDTVKSNAQFESAPLIQPIQEPDSVTEKSLEFKIPKIPGNSVSYVFTQWGSGNSATSFSFNVTGDKVTQFDRKSRFQTNFDKSFANEEILEISKTDRLKPTVKPVARDKFVKSGKQKPVVFTSKPIVFKEVTEDISNLRLTTPSFDLVTTVSSSTYLS